MAIFVVTGPPSAGKSTWVNEHARPGDITVDFDRLAEVLSPKGDWSDYPDHVVRVAAAARRAAVDMAITLRGPDVYIIHAVPKPKMLAWYRARGARVVTIDPGEDVVLERCRNAGRSPAALKIAQDWYRGTGDWTKPMW